MQTISRIYERSCAVELGFGLAEFAALLDQVTVRLLGEHCDSKSRIALVETLHINDLVLAHACARGHTDAWERFVTLYRRSLYRAAVAIARDDCAGHELADSLYGELFGTSPSGDGRLNCKLSLYSGRGSLQGWLRSVLAQEYVNRVRRERKLVALDHAMSCTAERTSFEESDEERKLLESSTDAALAKLTPEERLLLAAYYLDQRTMAEIGRILGLHESTVSRRMDKAIRTVRKHILGRLRSAGLSKQEAEEMLHTDVRSLGVDVRERLAQGRQA